MKRFLSLMVAVVAVFMVGFTTVKADQINLVSGKKFFEGAKSPVNGGARDFHLKQVSGNSSAYAFCLDSQHVFYVGKYNSNPGLNYNSKKIENVILKAYLAGLGTDKNVYGISNDELYEITQMAVWYASHGNGTDGMLPGDTYINWINAEDYRLNIYNYLINDNNVPTFTDEPSILNWKGTLKPDAKKEYFVSSDFTINGSKDLVFTVSASNGNGSCVLYGDTCEKTQMIPGGASFKLRTNYVANDEVNVSAEITVSKYLTGYSFNLYQPEVTQNNQNAAVFIPKFDKYNDYVTATGCDDVKKKPTTLKVSKTDGTGQEELAGAEMKVYELGNDKPFDSWTSEKGVQHQNENLIIDNIYRMEQVSSPVGFDKLTVNIYFKLDDNGKVQLCDVKNNDESTASCGGTKFVDENGVTYAEINGGVLVIKNYPSKTTKLTVSKTDGTGQEELDGAEMKVYELENDKLVDSWTSKKGVQHQIENLIIGKIYRMEEVSSPVGFDKLTVNIYFKLDDNGKVQLCDVKNNDEATASCGGTKFVDENGVTYAEINGGVLVIKNYPSKTTKVIITKRDFTNGEEIKGAHLQILDENGNIVADWISEDKPYEIEGLKPGKYTLIETLPADNYNVEMIIDGNRTSRYEFEITENGITKIDVYNEIMGVPNTGINASSTYIIGGFVMLIGAATIVIAKKKELF